MKFLVVASSRSIPAFLKLIVTDIEFDYASDLQESQNFTSQNDYKLTLVEWSIVSESGYDCLEQLPHPIIAMCSTMRKSNVVDIVDHGCAGLVGIPFTKERINNCLLQFFGQSEQTTVQDEEVQAAKEPTRLLFCDDEEDMIELIQAELEELGGYICTYARDGNEGAKLLDEEEFDALITDIDMPGINGMDLIRRVREGKKNRYIPAFIFSGAVSREVEDFAKSYVINLFYKPFDPLTILKEIHHKIFPARSIPSYHSTLVDYWYETLNEVLASQLEDFRFGTLEMADKVQNEAFINSDIGLISSNINGAIRLQCDLGFCKEFIGKILPDYSEDNTDDISEYVGELSNQLAGRLKLKLEAHGINLQITVPQTCLDSCPPPIDTSSAKTLCLKVQAGDGTATVFLSMSKIGDDLFGHKTKTVILDGGLFF